jgi:glyoxylase-like metal-dependent hydrolase (beta-lactamase superfamily II)
MPIRASDRHRYPKDWKSIRRRILERAHGRCEACGVENGAVGLRKRDGSFEPWAGMEAEAGALEGLRLTRIVLTVAHLDHTPENSAESNLRALCQRCHLLHDREQHTENARATRARKKDAARPLLAAMFVGEDHV